MAAPINPVEIICIGCPIGCDLTISQRSGMFKVLGNQCMTGVTYAREEMTNPTRNIATSVRITGGDMPMLSVKTSTPIPKQKIMAAVRAVHNVNISAPVSIGDVVLANVVGTGVDIVATRNVAAV